MVLKLYQKRLKRGFKDNLERFLEGFRELSERSQRVSGTFRGFQRVSRSSEEASGNFREFYMGKVSVEFLGIF